MSALMQYAAFMSGWTGNVRNLETPCCGNSLSVRAPGDSTEQWDSLVDCPYCGQMFMKVVTSTAAEGRIPPFAPGVPA